MTKKVHIKKNDSSSTGNTFTIFFFGLFIISADDFVKTFTIFTLSDASLQNFFNLSESPKKLFREMYPFRDDNPLFFSGFHFSPDMFNINKDVVRRIITQVFAETRQKPGPFGPPGFFGPPGAVNITGNGNGAERSVFQNVVFSIFFMTANQ